MFTPKYRILITSGCFPKNEVIGLGTQLISIINSFKDFLPQHLWYAADVEAVGVAARKYNVNSFRLNMIGTDSKLIEYCSEIEQFIWGEFLCINSEFLSQNFQNIELETEDLPFRPVNLNGVLMEIRVFDTTYFGIYSEDIDLINYISKLYNVEVQENKSF